VEADLPYVKKSYPISEAVEIFRSQNMKEKEKLFRYRRSSYVNVYCLDGYYDYYYGYMLPSTGYIKYFQVFAYEDGLMLLLTDPKRPEELPQMEPRKKLFETLRQSDDWGNMVNVGTVGDLNDQICRGNINDLILVQEALQERRIGEIAREIVERKGVKFVMIAGPSSSGKTTFSHRLSIQLRTYGLSPHPIALDNYFVNREDTPRDEKGDYNFVIGAMPESREDIKNLVAFCYKEDADIQFQLQNAVTYELDTINEMLKVLSKVFLYVGIGFALFASLMLANFIGTSISHKKQEIGILRAIGSRSNDVFRIFFSESFIIAMINFLLSAVGVFVATSIINAVIRKELGVLITVLNFGLRQILLLFVVSLFVATLASFLPVKKIASKKPIDAIRNR